jgi:hypothetical protein
MGALLSIWFIALDWPVVFFIISAVYLWGFAVDSEAPSPRDARSKGSHAFALVDFDPRRLPLSVATRIRKLLILLMVATLLL